MGNKPFLRRTAILKDSQPGGAMSLVYYGRAGTVVVAAPLHDDGQFGAWSVAVADKINSFPLRYHPVGRINAK